MLDVTALAAADAAHAILQYAEEIQARKGDAAVFNRRSPEPLV
jgi:hypothetical protein